MINEVAKKYNITKRTLRYYEEIGLLTNIRKNNAKYRYYDKAALNRLEQILLLRDLSFNISEIREILISEDGETINRLLYDKLKKLQDNIDYFISLKQIIASIISIRDDIGMEEVSIYQILKEQIYIHKNIEGVFEMSQFVGDVIVIEFGLNIVEGATMLIDNIKRLRQDIKSEHNQEIPLVRIRDVDTLKDNEYKIMIKGITVKQGLLENKTTNERVDTIIDELKEATICNIQSVIS